VTDWDGRGLPPAAQARMERGRAGGPASSLLGISGQAALEACGFSPVGEVMGCIVHHIGWQGFGGCGYYGYSPLGMGTFGAPAQAVTSGGAGGWVGFGAYSEALYHGYDTAILRMLLETKDIGADGVVGVRLQVSNMGEGNREFLAYGTAVRAHSKTRPANLFSTQLAGNDVAKMLHGGWVPVSICVGLSIAIRHDDWTTRNQASAWAGNVEVSGYTDLVNHVRNDARNQFQRRSAAYGAEAAVMSSMGLDIWEQEVGENHRDHVALATVMGTAIARFHKEEKAPTDSLLVLPMTDPAVRIGGKR
jgi:uncharacterized protein YbjQ (UPF0145 family)